ncbi:hypothetical protein V1515DRAFT_616144 [Lipomyces mesembrius]
MCICLAERHCKRLSYPQSASARRASRSVAPIATPVSEISQPSNREACANATRATAKRKAMDNEPAIHAVNQISSTCNSALTGDSSAEHSKHRTLDTTDESMVSDYREAFRLLKDNPPDQRLEIHMPLSVFATTGCVYPYLSYNSLTVFFSCHCRDCPNYIHEVAVYELNFMFASATEYLSEHAPGFSNQPDGGVVYTAIDACSRVTIATEVGISQSYKSLCDAKDVWINGHHAKVCILVYVNELSNPTTVHHGIEDVRTEITTMNQNVAAMWAGELNEAFIEIWRTGNSSPDRYELIQDGFACHNLPTNLGLKMSMGSCRHPDREIRFNSARFMMSLILTAETRFRKFIRYSTN